MTFNLEKALRHLGIRTLSPMQEASRKAFLDGRDIILLSPTGSGKTLAFLLPLCEKLTGKQQSTGENYAQAVVLAPSRELAIQIQDVVKKMDCGLKAFALYGGRPTMDEHRRIKEMHPNILIATPGRINDHLKKGNFSTSQIEILVIDEFDKSLELGFQEEMAEVISQLPSVRQRILLSATDAASIPEFAGISRTIRLDYLKENDNLNTRLKIQSVSSPAKDKLQTLYNLLCALGESKIIIFVGYRESAERVSGFLLAKGFTCDTYHGGMEQENRERALYKFRGGSCPILVATDLAARGLDITDLDYVIHYHLPASYEAFTHRNGRTARWKAEGGAFVLLGPEEKVSDYMEAKEEFCMPPLLGKPFRPKWASIYIGKGKKDKISKYDVVGFLSKKGGLNKDDLGTVDVSDHFSFATVRREKLKQLLQQVKGERIKGIKTIIEEAR